MQQEQGDCLKNRLKRHPERAIEDKKWILELLASSYLGHVAFIDDGIPYIIPMSIALFEEQLILHASKASRIANVLQNGQYSCVSIAHLDALVLAHSVFDHSMNYRSVVIWDKARALKKEEKREALKAISDQLVPGQWDYVRQPSPEELAQTTVLAYSLENATAKRREGPPGETDAAVWTGLVPMHQGFSAPVPSPCAKDKELPKHIIEMSL